MVSLPCCLIASPAEFGVASVLRALQNRGDECVAIGAFVFGKDVLEADISVLEGALASELEPWRRPSAVAGLIKI